MSNELTALQELRAYLAGLVAVGVPQRVADSILEFAQQIETEAAIEARRLARSEGFRPMRDGIDYDSSGQ